MDFKVRGAEFRTRTDINELGEHVDFPDGVQVRFDVFDRNTFSFNGYIVISEELYFPNAGDINALASIVKAEVVNKFSDPTTDNPIAT